MYGSPGKSSANLSVSQPPVTWAVCHVKCIKSKLRLFQGKQNLSCLFEGQDGAQVFFKSSFCKDNSETCLFVKPNEAFFSQDIKYELSLFLTPGPFYQIMRVS